MEAGPVTHRTVERGPAGVTYRIGSRSRGRGARAELRLPRIGGAGWERTEDRS